MISLNSVCLVLIGNLLISHRKTIALGCCFLIFFCLHGLLNFEVINLKLISLIQWVFEGKIFWIFSMSTCVRTPHWGALTIVLRVLLKILLQFTEINERNHACVAKNTFSLVLRFLQREKSSKILIFNALLKRANFWKWT